MIFAREKLSVQVHPDDRLAQKYGEPRGKTECWYALAAEAGAQVAAGLKSGVTLDALRAGIEAGTLEKSLKVLPVHAGDMIYVDAGTVHAIWPGSVLLETQQNCDLTYRMYDYGRGRELHIEKSLKAVRLKTKAGKVMPKFLKDRTVLVERRIFLRGEDSRAGESFEHELATRRRIESRVGVLICGGRKRSFDERRLRNGGFAFAGNCRGPGIVSGFRDSGSRRAGLDSDYAALAREAGMTNRGWRERVVAYIRIEAQPEDKFGHQPRLYALAGKIGAGMDYDDDIVFAAAWMHDLGVFLGHRPKNHCGTFRMGSRSVHHKPQQGALDGVGFPCGKAGRS